MTITAGTARRRSLRRRIRPAIPATNPTPAAMPVHNAGFARRVRCTPPFACSVSPLTLLVSIGVLLLFVVPAECQGEDRRRTGFRVPGIFKVEPLRRFFRGGRLLVEELQRLVEDEVLARP